MIKKEYVIINKTTLLKRIEEIIVEQKNIIKKLKKLYEDLKGSNKYFDYKDNLSRYFTALTNEKRLLEKILSQSTPLIPEIEKAIQFGLFSFEEFDANSNYDAQSRIEGLKEIQQDYISNLKLDI